MSFLHEIRRCASRGGACDSSQLSSVLGQGYTNQVQEEEFIQQEHQSLEAVPFNESSEKTFLIANGTVVNANQVLEVDILVENGKISQIGSDLVTPEGTKVIDAKDKYVIPGAIDYHAELNANDPELLCESTKPKVLGGITTVVDVLSNKDVDALKDDCTSLQDSKLYTNLAVKLMVDDIGTFDQENIEMLVKEQGINTYILRPEQIFTEDDEDLLDLMKGLKKHGCMLNVDTDLGTWNSQVSAPEEDLQEIALMKICTLALQVDIPVCFLKVDNNLTADLIAKYREKGLKAYGEVSTTAENMRHINTDQDNLLVSSARPVCKSSEVEDEGDLEDWLSLVYNELVRAEKADVSKFVELTSASAAKLLNLYPQKGCIAESSDADIVILNPMLSQTVSLPSSKKYKITAESELFGTAEYVLVDGNLVVSDCQLRSINNCGQFVSLQPLQATEARQVRKPLQRLDRPGDDNRSTKEEMQRGWDRRKCISQGEIFDKELGIYQRPLSAHGVRNQQDSTFTVKTFF